ncbi:hypothetical protein FDI21_gp055 [Pseudomonas phage Noxifer]|uniref:Uncharacterized protein n=1 Tax=Pseudomonas phage Noxifer TaxID=2006684 RepID=A0A1Y0SZW9_9CAUD|nr:hypothetical protein FDI21_gp055 [Pseudomonas phage Noxifer]ARV77226.1 hypothetical protein NOXIFER_55 [Pseudomonas phage Noxifer]
MPTYIPTMSMMGWTGTPHEKAAYMIGCFIAANYSQSTALYGKITTLQYLVKKYAQRLDQLENELRTLFEEKVNATFPGVATSTVYVRQTTEDNPAIWSISLICEITENGRVYTIGKLVQFNNSVMTKISDIANG